MQLEGRVDVRSHLKSTERQRKGEGRWKASSVCSRGHQSWRRQPKFGAVLRKSELAVITSKILNDLVAGSQNMLQLLNASQRREIRQLLISSTDCWVHGQIVYLFG